jgi:hypothetical protein
MSRQEFRADQRVQFLAAVNAAAHDPEATLTIETDKDGNTVAIINARTLEANAQVDTVSTPESAFNEATLKVSVAIGTLDLVTDYCEQLENSSCGVTICRGTVEALYGALYHLRDAYALLSQIPAKRVQS